MFDRLKAILNRSAKKSSKEANPTPPAEKTVLPFVVCETLHAMVLHVRRGSFQPCGHQDSDALCGAHPAWDTQIPLEALFAPRDPGTWICSDCKQQLGTYAPKLRETV